MNIYLEKFINEKFPKPKNALDLGAGKGFDVACLTKLGWIALGADKPEVDLEKPIHAEQFELVYSNYVLPFIKNKQVFAKTCYDSLEDNGWLFIHTFSKEDKTINGKGQSREEIQKLFGKYFDDIDIKERKVYDNEHEHWHCILEVTAKKEAKDGKRAVRSVAHH